MSLLNDILDWAKEKLAPWQRDALRRLFLQQELSSQDYDDFYGMLKSAHGLIDPHNRQPVPLANEHLPVQPTSESPVILRALRDLKNVNRIESGTELKFSPRGVTVIYGGTAAGKSGYARVLKQACRARDLSETVHPDAFDAAAVDRIPEATFDITVGGIDSSPVWKRDSDPPDELSTIAVFDGRCARAYLDDEQDVAYLPYGLDIIEGLGRRVLPLLLERLKSDIAAIDTATTAFSDLLGDTAVGRLVKFLSYRTPCRTVTSLGRLSSKEKERLAALDKTLSEQDPMAKARDLRQSAQRINGLKGRVEGAIASIDDATIEKLRELDVETEAACTAESAAASGFRSKDSLLPGTGEHTWSKLFEAARRFSVEEAYPEKGFPHVEGDAKCLLCQQPLVVSAAERMRRFENFVKQDTAKVAAEKRQTGKETGKGVRKNCLGGWLTVSQRGVSVQSHAPPHHAIDLGTESNRSPGFSEPRPPGRLCGGEFWRAKPRPTQWSNSAARVSAAARHLHHLLCLPSCLHAPSPVAFTFVVTHLCARAS